MIPRQEVEVFRQLIETALKEADPESELGSSQSLVPKLISSAIRNHGFFPTRRGGII